MKVFIVLVVSVCLLFGCAKDITTANSEIKQAEISIDKINQEVSKLTEQINAVASNIEKTNVMASNMSEAALSDLNNINEKAVSVSASMEAVVQVMEKTASKTFEELISRANALDNIHKQINDKTEDFIGYLDGLMENRSVDEMLSVISNGNWADSVKDAMYMRIIAQYPASENAFNEYLGFLNEIGAGVVYYYDLHTVLSSALYSVDIEDIPALISEIDSVNNIIEASGQNNTQLLTEVWSNIFEEFESVAKNFEGNRLTELYESLTEYHGMLSSTTIEMDNQYEYAQYIYSLYSSYKEYISFADGLLTEDFDTLHSMYSTSNSIFTTLITQFMSRDKEKDGVFSDAIVKMFKEIEAKGKAVNLRFENLLQREFGFKLSVAQNEIEKDDLNPSLYHVSGELQSLATLLSSLATSEVSYNLLDEYSKYLAKYQRALYVSYQEWAAQILSKANKALEKAKPEKKLQILFDEEYFNIDSSLLIPQLKTWYDSLCTETIIEKSSTPFESLVGKIHLMTLSDMGNIK